MSKKIKPLGNRLVVKRQEARTTKGGILLPETAQEKPRQGKVLSIGDGKLLPNGTRQPFVVKEGDKVLFSSWAGNEVRVDNDEFLIMTEDDLLAVVG